MLTESRADLLTEVMNLGMGHAANALNQLVDTHISLRIPEINLIPASEADQRFRDLGWHCLSAVQLEFEGILHGTMTLIFPAESATKLAALLTGDPAPEPHTPKAAIEETGNILLNGVIGAFSNLLEDHIVFSTPTYCDSGNLLRRVLSTSGNDTSILLARARVDAAAYGIRGEIFVCFEVNRADGLFATLDQRLAARSVTY